MRTQRVRRRRWRKGLRALAVAATAAASLVALVACQDLDVACIGNSPAVIITPRQITVAPGDSAVVTASVVMLAQWAGCEGRSRPPRKAVRWSISNPAVATVVPIDSLRARIAGVTRGQMTVIATAVDDPDVREASAVVVP